MAVSDELYIKELDFWNVVGVRFIWVEKRFWKKKSLNLLHLRVFLHLLDDLRASFEKRAGETRAAVSQFILLWEHGAVSELRGAWPA